VIFSRIARFFFGLWLVGAAAHAETNLILVGKHRAHPTKILARYSNVAAVQSSRVTLNSLGLEIASRVSSVPGLVILDDTARSRTAKVSPQGAVHPSEPEQVLLDRIAALRASGLFAYIQPNYMHSASLAPTDLRFTDGTLWALRNRGFRGGKQGADIGAEVAWDITTGSTNVIVAVIDSGIRLSHRDLARQLWRNPEEIPGNGIDDELNGYVDDVSALTPSLAPVRQMTTTTMELTWRERSGFRQ
jgi:hypothetical protein